MLKRRLAKSHDEFLWDLMDSYRRERGGGYSMEDLSGWILDNQLLPPPHISPKQLLTQRLKRAARRRRFTDAQRRSVRTMLPAKYERLDENGNMFFEVIWDYLHQMSLHHALVAFQQRDENIGKQRRAATRDLQSALDNNPNLMGHEAQFTFDFMLEEPSRVLTETIGESPIKQGGVPRSSKRSPKPR